MKGVTFGQYYPADSVMHRLDPRAKLIGAIAYIVAAFLCRNLFSFVLLFLSAIMLTMISRIPLRMVLRSIRALIFVMAFTAVINVFWITDANAEPLFEWRFIAIYERGIYQAVFILIRIVSMVMATGLFLTYTTSPIALTDAIERLLCPLSKLKVPVHEFAMMMTIALRFIPTIMEETEKIMAAQKARGADFTTGNLIRRVRAIVPIIIPLFAASFRRAGDLATAMECRCYHGGGGRTKLRVLRFEGRDVVALLLIVLFMAAVVTANILCAHFGWGYTL